MAEIIAFAENPPVDIKMQKWDGAGRWALCSWFGNRLNGAGVAIANQTGVVSHHHPDWNASSLSGLPLFPTELEIEDYKRNCTSVDLNNWEWPEHETFFFFLCSRQYYQVYVWSASAWQNVWHEEPTSLTVLKLRKEKHAYNDGYKLDIQDIYSTTYHYQWKTVAGLSEWCSWSNFTSPAPDQAAAILEIRIEAPLVMVSTTQGVLPQLWTLFGSVGGYIALLSLVFRICFVKKYPDSGVSQIYDARTFFGERIGFPQSNDNPGVPPPLPPPPGMFRHLQHTE